MNELCIFVVPQAFNTAAHASGPQPTAKRASHHEPPPDVKLTGHVVQLTSLACEVNGRSRQGTAYERDVTQEVGGA